MAVFLRKLWRQKPPPGVQLDWGHPLAKGLFLCMPFNEGGGQTAWNLARAQGNVLSGPSFCSIRPDGFHGPSGASASGVLIQSASWNLPSSQVTVACSASLYSSGYSRQHLIDSTATGSDIKWGLGNPLAHFSSNQVGFYPGQGGESSAITIPSSGKFTDILGTYNGLAAKVFQDRRQFWSASLSGAIDATGTYLVIGGDNTYRAFEGIIGYAYAWNRALADGEAVAIQENPWQIFQPVRRVLYSFALQDVADVASGGASAAGAADAAAEGADVATGGSVAGGAAASGSEAVDVAQGGAAAGGAAAAASEAADTASGGASSGDRKSVV